jgi:uncharacterized membrane protein (UPF0136 family)
MLPSVRGDGDVRAGRNSALGRVGKLRQPARMNNFEIKVLWVYIVLLLAGGLIGFFKARSKVSLITSAVFAALLILTTLRGVFQPGFALGLANVILVLLLLVFTVRLGKTKKFMPSGLILVATVAVLALLNIKF